MGFMTGGDTMLIGCSRVSTDDQNLDPQRDALRAAGCQKIYEDRMSGAKAARPGLAQAMEIARASDVLAVGRPSPDNSFVATENCNRCPVEVLS